MPLPQSIFDAFCTPPTSDAEAESPPLSPMLMNDQLAARANRILCSSMSHSNRRSSATSSSSPSCSTRRQPRDEATPAAAETAVESHNQVRLEKEDKHYAAELDSPFSNLDPHRDNTNNNNKSEGGARERDEEVQEEEGDRRWFLRNVVPYLKWAQNDHQKRQHEQQQQQERAEEATDRGATTTTASTSSPASTDAVSRFAASLAHIRSSSSSSSLEPSNADRRRKRIALLRESHQAKERGSVLQQQSDRVMHYWRRERRWLQQQSLNGIEQLVTYLEGNVLGTASKASSPLSPQPKQTRDPRTSNVLPTAAAKRSTCSPPSNNIDITMDCLLQLFRQLHEVGAVLMLRTVPQGGGEDAEPKESIIKTRDGARRFDTDEGRSSHVRADRNVPEKSNSDDNEKNHRHRRGVSPSSRRSSASSSSPRLAQKVIFQLYAHAEVLQYTMLPRPLLESQGLLLPSLSSRLLSKGVAFSTTRRRRGEEEEGEDDHRTNRNLSPDEGGGALQKTAVGECESKHDAPETTPVATSITTVDEPPLTAAESLHIALGLLLRGSLPPISSSRGSSSSSSGRSHRGTSSAFGSHGSEASRGLFDGLPVEPEWFGRDPLLCSHFGFSYLSSSSNQQQQQLSEEAPSSPSALRPQRPPPESRSITHNNTTAAMNPASPVVAETTTSTPTATPAWWWPESKKSNNNNNKHSTAAAGGGFTEAFGNDTRATLSLGPGSSSNAVGGGGSLLMMAAGTTTADGGGNLLNVWDEDGIAARSSSSVSSCCGGSSSPAATAGAALFVLKNSQRGNETEHEEEEEEEEEEKDCGVHWLAQQLDETWEVAWNRIPRPPPDDEEKEWECRKTKGEESTVAARLSIPLLDQADALLSRLVQLLVTSNKSSSSSSSSAVTSPTVSCATNRTALVDFLTHQFVRSSPPPEHKSKDGEPQTVAHSDQTKDRGGPCCWWVARSATGAPTQTLERAAVGDELEELLSTRVGAAVSPSAAAAAAAPRDVSSKLSLPVKEEGEGENELDRILNNVVVADVKVDGLLEAGMNNRNGDEDGEKEDDDVLLGLSAVLPEGPSFMAGNDKQAKTQDVLDVEDQANVLDALAQLPPSAAPQRYSPTSDEVGLAVLWLSECLVRLYHRWLTELTAPYLSSPRATKGSNRTKSSSSSSSSSASVAVPSRSDRVASKLLRHLMRHATTLSGCFDSSSSLLHPTSSSLSSLSSQEASLWPFAEMLQHRLQTLLLKWAHGCRFGARGCFWRALRADIFQAFDDADTQEAPHHHEERGMRPADPSHAFSLVLRAVTVDLRPQFLHSSMRLLCDSSGDSTLHHHHRRREKQREAKEGNEIDDEVLSMFWLCCVTGIRFPLRASHSPAVGGTSVCKTPSPSSSSGCWMSSARALRCAATLAESFQKMALGGGGGSHLSPADMFQRRWRDCLVAFEQRQFIQEEFASLSFEAEEESKSDCGSIIASLKDRKWSMAIPADFGFPTEERGEGAGGGGKGGSYGTAARCLPGHRAPMWLTMADVVLARCSVVETKDAASAMTAATTSPSSPSLAPTTATTTMVPPPNGNDATNSPQEEQRTSGGGARPVRDAFSSLERCTLALQTMAGSIQQLPQQPERLNGDDDEEEEEDKNIASGHRPNLWVCTDGGDYMQVTDRQVLRAVLTSLPSDLETLETRWVTSFQYCRSLLSSVVLPFYHNSMVVLTMMMPSDAATTRSHAASTSSSPTTTKGVSMSSTPPAALTALTNALRSLLERFEEAISCNAKVSLSSSAVRSFVAFLTEFVMQKLVWDVALAVETTSLGGSSSAASPSAQKKEQESTTTNTTTTTTGSGAVSPPLRAVAAAAFAHKKKQTFIQRTLAKREQCERSFLLQVTHWFRQTWSSALLPVVERIAQKLQSPLRGAASCARAPPQLSSGCRSSRPRTPPTELPLLAEQASPPSSSLLIKVVRSSSAAHPTSTLPNSTTADTASHVPSSSPTGGGGWRYAAVSPTTSTTHLHIRSPSATPTSRMGSQQDFSTLALACTAVTVLASQSAVEAYLHREQQRSRSSISPTPHLLVSSSSSSSSLSSHGDAIVLDEASWNAMKRAEALFFPVASTEWKLSPSSSGAAGGGSGRNSKNLRSTNSAPPLPLPQRLSNATNANTSSSTPGDDAETMVGDVLLHYAYASRRLQVLHNLLTDCANTRHEEGLEDSVEAFARSRWEYRRSMLLEDCLTDMSEAPPPHPNQEEETATGGGGESDTPSATASLHVDGQAAVSAGGEGGSAVSPPLQHRPPPLLPVSEHASSSPSFLSSLFHTNTPIAPLDFAQQQRDIGTKTTNLSSFSFSPSAAASSAAARGSCRSEAAATAVPTPPPPPPTPPSSSAAMSSELIAAETHNHSGQLTVLHDEDPSSVARWASPVVPLQLVLSHQSSDEEKDDGAAASSDHDADGHGDGDGDHVDDTNGALQHQFDEFQPMMNSPIRSSVYHSNNNNNSNKKNIHHHPQPTPPSAHPPPPHLLRSAPPLLSLSSSTTSNKADEDSNEESDKLPSRPRNHFYDPTGAALEEAVATEDEEGSSNNNKLKKGWLFSSSSSSSVSTEQRQRPQYNNSSSPATEGHNSGNQNKESDDEAVGVAAAAAPSTTNTATTDPLNLFDDEW